jgi:thioredoxin 1
VVRPLQNAGSLLEQLAAESQGRIKFTKLNVDDASALAGTYQITGVPTLMLFSGGQAVGTQVGLVSPKALKAWLEGAAIASPQVPATSSL